jgi:two-component system, NtrC family, sensor kinase
VAGIVQSRKAFAQPGAAEMAPVDLNRAIEHTLTIARPECGPVADVETDLGALPPVVCHAGDINEALLHIIVNAAHAIADTGRRGRIAVRSRVEGDRVAIAISDTGGGIPDSIRDRVFDPFFTTREVGRGSGQGLSIARSVIVDRHGGELSFQSAPDAGTTFFIRLPIRRARAAPLEPAHAPM